jgi:hypothetical protein
VTVSDGYSGVLLSIILREFQAQLRFSTSPQAVKNKSFLSLLRVEVLGEFWRVEWQTAPLQPIENLFSSGKDGAGIVWNLVVFVVESRGWRCA